MIPEKYIKQYLNRDVDDFRWMKELSHKQIDAMLAALKPAPNYYPGMGLHQKVGLYLGITLGYFAYWYDMGTGKTLLSLELLQYWWDTNQMRRAFVFVTSDKAYDTWERQMRQYKINVPFCALDGNTSKDKWKKLDNFEDGIILVHYPGAAAMVKDRRSSKKLDKKLIAKFTRDVDAVVYDEITKAGNTQSLTHKMCWKVARAATQRYGLAGMPFGRDPTPLWGQMKLVDRGEALGETLGLFRAAFFIEEKNEYAQSDYAFDYTFKEKMKPKLARLQRHTSLTYTADECIDLPPERDIPVMLKLPANTKAYYVEMVDELIAAKKGGMRAMENAFHRLRQLSSGFLGLKDDDTGERAEIDFDPNPKMEWLLDLADTFPEKRKMLIFYQYTHSGRAIVENFKKEFGLDVPWLWSGTKDSRQVINDFIDDPRMPFCVVNNQVGAYSLDGLQCANYTVFYEPPLSSIDHEQARRRTRRQGQKHRTVFFYYPTMLGTVDEKIREFHQQGRDLFRAVCVDPKAVLGA